MMQGAVGDTERKILWSEAFVLARQGEVIFEAQHQGSEGILLDYLPENFDESGYWIGYLWLDPRVGKTYMAMTPEEKMQHSTVKKKLLQDLQSFGWGLGG